MSIPVINLASLDGSDGFRIQNLDEYSGVGVSNAGDLNGDGFDDVVVGAPGSGRDYDFDGSAYVVFGKVSGFESTFDVRTLDGSNGFLFKGDRDGSTGASISGGGDINGDGYEDLIVGAPLGGANYSQPEGASYVIFGKASGFSASIDGEQLNGTDGFVLDGASDGDLAGRVSHAGDVNGDGFDDVIVGAPWADPNGDKSGSSYVIFGKASGFEARLNLANLVGNNGFSLDGFAALDFLGSAVRSAGDVNGDGFDDVSIIAPGTDANGVDSGSSYVVFGKASGFSATFDLSDLDGSNGFRLDGKTGDDQSSIRFGPVNKAGDIDGDGIDDVIVAALRIDSNGSSFGECYVVFGKTSGFDATLDLSSLNGVNGFRLEGAGGFGVSVSAAGDVNGDGVDDLIVGASSADSNGASAGSSYVMFGRTSAFEAAINIEDLELGEGVRLDGAGAHDRSGSSVSGAGDVNGDGFEDLMVNTYFYSFGGGYTGAAYVIFGSDHLTGMNAISGTDGDDVLTGTSADDRFEAGRGNDVLIGGGGQDIFQAGDGNDVIQVPDANFHFAGGGLGDNTLKLTGNKMTLALADFDKKTDDIETVDLTGDGNNLFVIDNPREMNRTLTILGDAGDRVAGITPDWVDEGLQGDFHVYTFSNDAYSEFTLRVEADVTRVEPLDLSDIENSKIFRLNGEEQYRGFLMQVSNAGDVNGDGFDDVIVGAPWADPNGDRSGASYVVFGKASGFDAPLNLSSLDGDNGFQLTGIKYSYSGHSVSSAGDVNGDGFDDVVIGAEGEDLNGFDSGASYIVFGKASGFDASIKLFGLNGNNGFTLRGESNGDHLGNSVSSAGDVNGDGFDDLIVGAYRADTNGYDSGASYIVFGKASGFAAELDLSSLDGSNGFRIDGENTFGNLGESVSSAGDVNGDGFADMIVDDWIVFGKASGFSATLDLSGLDGSNGFGMKDLSRTNSYGKLTGDAGDVNGDGFDDVLIQEGFYKSYGSDPDSMYVVFGKASGFDATVDLSLLDGNNGFRVDDVPFTRGSDPAVSDVGDVNGDGFDDIIIGAPESGLGGAFKGGSYVMFGKASGFDAVTNLGYLDDGIAGFSITDEVTGYDFGSSVSGAGDVNGDGIDDLIIAVPYGAKGGSSYILFGSSDIGHGGSGGGLPVIPGTPDDDVLRGTSIAEIFEAGEGNDILIGHGGADVFHGGAGVEQIKVPDLNFASIDGGIGNDILHLDGKDLNLDLTLMGDKIHGIETICLYGRGDNTLALTADSVLDLSNTSNTLKLHGNAGDRVTMLDDDWADGGVKGFYHTYTNDDAVLLVGANLAIDFV
ncbi:MAG: hypothetical protein DYH15_12875 [Nitrosomonas sp. PRO4]|nr:hypothetical protein [Nitrosomonas sp. PRO4]